MGERMQSLKSLSALFSFLNEHRKMIENARKCKWSPFLRCPWKWDEKHGFNNQLLSYLLIFQAADSFPLATVNYVYALLSPYYKPFSRKQNKTPASESTYKLFSLCWS